MPFARPNELENHIPRLQTMAGRVACISRNKRISEQGSKTAPHDVRKTDMERPARCMGVLGDTPSQLTRRTIRTRLKREPAVVHGGGRL
jgi:hypothetical protein